VASKAGRVLVGRLRQSRIWLVALKGDLQAMSRTIDNYG
jgi:hypothetical protein